VPAFRAKSKRQYCGMSFAVARMGDDSNGWQKISRALQGCAIAGRGEICNLKAAGCIFRLTGSRFPWNPFYRRVARGVEKVADSQRFWRPFRVQSVHDMGSALPWMSSTGVPIIEVWRREPSIWRWRRRCAIIGQGDCWL